MADQARDGQRLFRLAHLDSDRIANAKVEELGRHAFDPNVIFFRPASLPEFDQLVLLVIEIVQHVHDALLPLILRVNLVAYHNLVVRLHIFHAWNTSDAESGVAVNERGQSDVEVRGNHRFVRSIQGRIHLVGHAEHDPNGKHAGGNAQHHE